ncbi:MAG TPA: endonuclease/exonuclease/phosphatase family protein [Bacteroidales bacterium]|nr:endonuclease/exonuclease/phosphatase family protein [Bacteroidales bacterium]
MKKFVLLASLLLILLCGCKRKPGENDLKVITLNVRYDNPGDSMNAWPNRIPLVLEFFRDQKPDLIGLQEVLFHQYELLDSVWKDYSSVGAGRDDGAKSGEMNPVFFRKDKFDLIRSKTFWLSEAPEIPGSMAWGAGLPRIVTWVELADKSTLKHFYFFNTHFAHDSDSARIMSAKLLLSKVDSLAAGFPFIITGDFNMLHSSQGYSILTGPYESVPLLADSYAITDKRPVGPAYTFHGFSEKSSTGRIDFIFVRNGMKVLEHRVFIRKDHGIYISDHWPVMAVVELKPSRHK